MTPIDARLPRNGIIRRFPATLEVFHAFRIDSCCGGPHPVGEAAVRHGVDAEVLLEELRRVAGER